MANLNYKQIFAKKERIKKDWLRLNPNLEDKSGIYILTREENGFKYAYCGQALKVLSRLVSHSEGYNQHIDLSIKKHKLWKADNPTGWKVQVMYLPAQRLNEAELHYTKELANKGYQLRNKTGGSQGAGKFGIDDNKPSKGYRDGILQGEKRLKKALNELLGKYLLVTPKNDTKLAKRALDKFNSLLSEE